MTQSALRQTVDHPAGVEVSRVPLESIEYVWNRVRRSIERALSHGCGDSITADQLLAKILSGDMTMWAVHEGPEILACVVLSVHTYPAKLTLVVELLAGRDMDRWAEKVEGLLRDCRDLIGADTIEASCRAGLAKRLVGRGWKSKAVIVELK